MEETTNLVVGIFAVTIGISIIVVYILFLITQQNILKAIQPENRLMRPGQVWLQLIPLYRIIYQFIVVNRISDSIRREFESWQFDSILGPTDAESSQLLAARPAYDIGLAVCILDVCTLIPVIGYIVWIPMFVCVIIYWSKLRDYKRKIENRIFA